MKRIKLQGLLVLGLAAMLSAGCAQQMREAFGAASQEDISAVRADVAALKSSKADGTAVVTVATTVATVAKAVGEVKQKGEANAAAITGLDGRVGAAERGIVTLADRMGKADEWAKGVIAALDKKADGAVMDQRFNEVSGKIAGAVASARASTARVAERTGEAEDRAGVADSNVVKIGPFPVAKYDEDAKAFTVCAGLSDALKEQIEKAKKRIADDGFEIEKVVGGADVRKIVGKGGKPLANSDELNGLCAGLRAQAVAEELGFDKDKTIGRGPTARYGEPYDPNRMVRVYLKKK